jgi:hypothetical protein
MIWHEIVAAVEAGHDYLICPDGIRPVSPANGSAYELEELYELLDCTSLELLCRASGWIMLGDEEAKLRRDAERKRNPVASRIYRHAHGLPSEELPHDGLDADLLPLGGVARVTEDGAVTVIEVGVAGFEMHEIVGNALVCAAWRIA